MCHHLFYRLITRLMAASLVALVTLPAAQAAGISMDCDRSEMQSMGMHPQGRSRTERFRSGKLKVRWQGGSHIFEDRLPNTEQGIIGEHYAYCGYNPLARMHLVGKDGGNRFTGLLINDLNGQIVEAGYTVLLSPDLSRFFAVREENDVHGEVWVIATFDGKKLWEGHSSILAAEPPLPSQAASEDEDQRPNIIAELDDPHWLPSGELEATQTCTAAPAEALPTKVILKRVKTPSGSSHYQWVPKVLCPVKP